MADELRRLTAEWMELYESRTASPDDLELAAAEHKAWIMMRALELSAHN